MAPSLSTLSPTGLVPWGYQQINRESALCPTTEILSTFDGGGGRTGKRSPIHMCSKHVKATRDEGRTLASNTERQPSKQEATLSTYSLAGTPVWGEGPACVEGLPRVPPLLQTVVVP